MAKSAKTTAKTPFKAEDFVHLHVHSHHSLLDGLSKIPKLLDRVKELGMSAVALTDHGCLNGAIEFYQGCRERGLKPIIGMEAYVARRSHRDKDADADRRFTHLILLVSSNEGYQNLMQLSTTAFLKGFYYKPRLDRQLLKKYNQGLIVLSGCMGGEIGSALQREDLKQAEETARWYKKVFGDRFYLELQDHPGHELQARVNQQLLELADKLDIELVVTADSHYLTPQDKEAHEILLCIQTRSFFDDPQRMTLQEFDLSLSPPAEMVARWQEVCPRALSNTKKIAEQCQLEIDFDRILMPHFQTPGGEDSFQYLKQLVFRGLTKCYADLDDEAAAKLTIVQARRQLPADVLKRADYELDTIQKTNFSDYFLIVWDFCCWGKQRGIFFGPGRGSAAGSIISYSLGITAIDPLRYDLLFERFLNVQRISMPDIDIDIEGQRRDEVIQYVIDKYGADRVANIITFGTMAARNAVRDVARVLRMSYLHADQLAKMMPPPLYGRNVSLADSLKEDKQLQAKYSSDEQVKKVFDLAMQLEGTNRSHGVHAAGVVIAPEPLVQFTPLEITAKGVITTQYSMKPIEKLGLLQMDFLGLANLTIIKNALRVIRKVYKETINLDRLDLEDDGVYQLLSRADTTGIFQLESRGMRQYLQRLAPFQFEDIAAMVALYRPGPLTAGIADQFIERRHGRQEVVYAHPSFKPIMENTYGVLVYQEQVIRLGRDICGFSGLEADELRRAIGKKERATMQKMKQKFIDGGVKVGKVEQPIMEKLWQDITGFADYAFNRAHSVSYGLIAYYTAYLKSHYRPAFMAAVLTSEAGDTDRLRLVVDDCHVAGISVLPPDVNESFVEFALVDNQSDKAKLSTIRFGLDAIKNVSSKAMIHLVENRQADGPFKDLADFIERQKNNGHLNRKTVESLIKAGALDCFMERQLLLGNLDQIMGALQWAAKHVSDKQVNLLDPDGQAQLDLGSFGFHHQVSVDDPIRSLDWERELLGIYISRHPLDFYRGSLKKLRPSPLAGLSSETSEVADNERRRVIGLLAKLRPATAKISRRKMAIIELEDKSGSWEVALSPTIFEKHPACWKEGNVLELTLQAYSVDFHGNKLPNVSWSVTAARKLEPDVAAKPG